VNETLQTHAYDSKYVGGWSSHMVRGQGVLVSVRVDVWVWVCIATVILRIWY